ncbi:hypothetical protein [Zooshikella ganghwensis]|uniref:Uncharacterized protein n=1 Tax=Zooshikella ganghwensis TaxID=202772 RepID=A0A4P9VTB2_9GAMM|nr:hypothetical protein [Zooshikella ganghwensis]RDH45907.1 hypothetical protein B9G39_21980 [Zooshikella ganghwensis]
MNKKAFKTKRKGETRLVFKLKYVGLLFIGIVVLPIYANSFVDKVVGGDGISIGGGPELNSEADMQSYRLSVLWGWHQDWLKSSSWLLSGYFDLSFFIGKMNSIIKMASLQLVVVQQQVFRLVPYFALKQKKPLAIDFLHTLRLVLACPM